MEIYAFGIVLLTAFILNVVGVGMMAAAFGIIIRRGGWAATLHPDDPSCNPAHRLMATGAGLAVVVCTLYFVIVSMAERLLD